MKSAAFDMDVSAPAQPSGIVSVLSWLLCPDSRAFTACGSVTTARGAGHERFHAGTSTALNPTALQRFSCSTEPILSNDVKAFERSSKATM
jgi:hypothetical protein